MKSPGQLLALIACGLGMVLVAAQAADVSSTKHNLTAGGPGTVTLAAGGESCVFCHTPHSANPIAPLWNREDPGSFYQTYESSTLQAVVGQPNGSSRLCLSCHDGTIALGQTYNPRNATGTSVYLSPGQGGYLGTDLRDDHPISFVYDSGLAVRKGELRDPLTLPEHLPLDQGGQLQCTTCHNAHDDSNGKFLTMDNTQSAMCITCHQVTDWETNPHATSTATLEAATRGNWANLTRGNQGQVANTVRDAACESCHRPHSGGGRPRLLRAEQEEDNCYACHDGSVAQTNILSEQQKLSNHPVGRTLAVHDPVENIQTMEAHVECADCHDPHGTPPIEQTATPPFIPPAMQGVSGVDKNGGVVTPARYEYEVCNKCHAGVRPVGTPVVSRYFGGADIGAEFRDTNDSFHPVVTQGRNPNVPSLVQNWTTASLMYCSTCHASDAVAGGAPRGPHGSSHAPLLAAAYSTGDNIVESPQAYALCYTCHVRDSILADESFTRHHLHIVDKTTPCSVCHDPHGVDATQVSSGSGTHLINFDSEIVQPTAAGQGPVYNDLGSLHGTCTLNCHGKEHVDLGY
jgi:predicted CXXCH cytochrome family protein